MTIRAGSLNRLIRFERRESARNEFNEEVGEWVEIARSFGQLRALNASERFQAMQTQSVVTALLTCRYSPLLAAVRASDRAIADGRIYDIQGAIDPSGRRRELQFSLVERSGDQ